MVVFIIREFSSGIFSDLSLNGFATSRGFFECLLSGRLVSFKRGSKTINLLDIIG